MIALRARLAGVEAVRKFDEKTWREILKLRQDSLPESWRSLPSEAEIPEWYREAMDDPKYIMLILREAKKAIGYLMATPQNEAVEELKEADPLMREDEGRYYVEIIHILPDYRKANGSVKLIFAFLDELAKKGLNRTSMHVRVNNGMSAVVQKLFAGQLTEIRRIENWKYYGGHEPTDYIEGTYIKK